MKQKTAGKSVTESNRSIEEKRDSLRVPLPTTIHFAPPSKTRHEHDSFVTDISLSGLCLRTRKELEPGKRLYLFIDHFDDVYEATGVVAWAKNVPPLLSRFVKNTVGVRFEQADKRLTELYKFMSGTNH